MTLNLRQFLFKVGWVRHAVCAVTHQACRQALIKNTLWLLRNVGEGYAQDAHPPYCEFKTDIFEA